MRTVAIHAEGLSKKYRLGQGEPYRALRDTLARLVRTPFAGQRSGKAAFTPGTRTPASEQNQTVWALRDVSFEIAQGEIVGLIGRNGAGKSTLLKILSRITKPTNGHADVYGRVGSLLEVGTGFHPELTGRENVYLNGAILGMKSVEIARKFDEIIAFAEVERFIDTPVKHYSSGMYMRLAFAVAAHLEPDILLVDEVLAVGDAAFQKKCLGRMGEVARGGRTVCFVSHQLNQIRRLCQRCIWIDAGQVRAYDTTSAVVSAYEATALQVAENPVEVEDRFIRWEVVGQGNVIDKNMFPITFRFFLCLKHPIVHGHFGLNIMNDANFLVAGWAFEDLTIASGTSELLVDLPVLPLRPGVYSLTCALFHQGNNLNGGELIAYWYALPELRIETIPVSHQQDTWTGVLNIPAQFVVRGVHNGES